MTDYYEGFDEPQGPDWWQANDGKWYPPESASGTVTATAVAERVPESSWRAMSSRHRMFLFGAIGVLVLGLVLAVAGFVAGGPDEGKRDELRADIDRTEDSIAATQDDLTEAAAVARGAAGDAADFVDDAEGIIGIVIEGCECGEQLTDAMEGLVRAVQTATRNPTDANIAALANALTRADEETVEFRGLLEEARSLMAERADVPGA